MKRIIRVVIDVESDPDEPMPIGLYVTTEEDVVTYKAPDGTIAHAPVDCVVCADAEWVM